MSSYCENHDGMSNIVRNHVIDEFVLVVTQSINYLVNYITSLDFHPAGETVETVDCNGICLVSDLNTDSYRFHKRLNSQGINYLSAIQFTGYIFLIFCRSLCSL